jgi:hypothetical protein
VERAERELLERIQALDMALAKAQAAQIESQRTALLSLDPKLRAKHDCTHNSAGLAA